jgi:hypothetical protein
MDKLLGKVNHTGAGKSKIIDDRKAENLFALYLMPQTLFIVLRNSTFIG